jgi:pimeloyl-ACP methyl ester carboxylesterase
MKIAYNEQVLTLLLCVAVGCGADDPEKEETAQPGAASVADGATGPVDGGAGAAPGRGDAGSQGARPDGAGNPGKSDAGSGAVGADGAPAEPPRSGGDGIMSPPPGGFEACTRELKPKCSYEDKEVACSSVMTASIPLIGGGTWGNVEIASGPYGAFVEWNEGKAFANPVSLLEGTCDLLAGAFGEPESVTKEVLDLRGQDLALYTVFRPACMKDGEKYPVISWGNGTCGQSGGYATLLATVASHGFVVIAANSRFTDAGNREMLRALDFAKASNEDPASGLYQKLDLEKVGAMGHSQGASATFNAASDPRIKAIILWNGGSRGASPAKPFLTVSGDRDTGATTTDMLKTAVEAATMPAAWLYYHKILETGGNVTGHLTLMQQPERVTDVTVAWWKYMLRGDAEAKKMFVGAECGLCNKPEDFEYGQKGLM